MSLFGSLSSFVDTCMCVSFFWFVGMLVVIEEGETLLIVVILCVFNRWEKEGKEKKFEL